MQTCLRCNKSSAETSGFCEECRSILSKNHSRKKKRDIQISPTQVQDAIQVQDETLQWRGPSQERVATSTLAAVRSPDWKNHPQHQPEQLAASSTQTVPQPGYRSRILKGKRISFKVLAIFSVLALLVNSALVWLVITHQHQNGGLRHTAPTLTIMPDAAVLGQTVQLRAAGLSSFSPILLARDFEQSVGMTTSLPTITSDPSGRVAIPLVIGHAWKSGRHVIEIEDIKTRSFVSAALTVIGNGPLLSPHLQVDASSLDMGSGYQGATTNQNLVLSNTGSGVISWTASSNQPWLRINSTHGIFSAGQTIKVAVVRTGLKEGDYQGTITILSSAGDPLTVQVHMLVRALPANPGPVLAILSPVLAFSGTDNGSDPASQTLSIANPGSRALHWSISSSAPTLSVGDISLPSSAGWLDIAPSSGELAPGATVSIHIHVHSHALLPGVYSGLLTLLSDQQALNTPQTVPVTLDLQSSCGVTANTDHMSFVLPAQPNAVSSQELNLSTMPGCMEGMPWVALSMARWLSVAPSSNQAGDHASTKATVKVDASSLAPGTYSGMFVVSTELRTQVITAQLVVLPPSTTSTQSGLQTSGGNTSSPTATQPVLELSSSSVVFNMTQGQANSYSQSVAVINSGAGTLSWHATSDAVGASWLSVTTVGNVLATGQTGKIMVNINDNGVASGTYNTRILISATNGAGSGGQAVQGSPQSLSVMLIVSQPSQSVQSSPAVQSAQSGQPCTLQVTPSSLTFSSSLLQSNPSSQSITVQETGDCASWATSANQSWVLLSPITGSSSGIITVNVNTQGMILGSHKAQITISAQDSQGTHSSTQTVVVTLNVLG